MGTADLYVHTNTLIQIDEEPTIQDAVADRSQMVKIMREHAERQTITHIPLTELLHIFVEDNIKLTERQAADPRYVRGMSTPAFELRCKECKITVDGIIGQVSAGHFWDMIGAFFHDVTRNLNDLQNGDWKPVAWKIHETSRQAAARAKKVRVEDWNEGITGPGPGGGVDRPTMYKTIEITQRRIVLTAAFADITQMDPLDTWKDRTGKDGSAVEKYVSERRLKHMPRRMAEERTLAEELIRAFYAGDGEAPASELTDAQLAMARVLRESETPWKDLEELFGLPWQTIKAQMARE